MTKKERNDRKDFRSPRFHVRLAKKRIEWLKELKTNYKTWDALFEDLQCLKERYEKNN